MAYPRHNKSSHRTHQPTRDKRETRDRDRGAKLPFSKVAHPASTPRKSVKRKKANKAGQVPARKLPAKTAKALVDYDLAHVKGAADQFGKRWPMISRGGLTAIGSFDQLMHEPGTFFSDLARQGVTILNPAMRRDIVNQIDAIRKWPRRIYVANRPGYNSGAWVRPDGKVLGKPSASNFRVNLGDRVVPLAKSGTLTGQQAWIKRFVDGQEVFVLALGVALVSPFLDLLDLANAGVEMTGESSTGKSTALDVGTCVWGAPLKQPGSIAMSMRGTLDGFEREMRGRHAAVFFGDEANLLGNFGSRQRGGAQADVAFMLGEGVEKARFNDLDVWRSRFGFLITSNASMRSQLSGADRDSVDAVLVRLITMPGDAGAGMGVLNHLPDGFDSSGAAIAALKAAMAAHHGHIADAFLLAFLKTRKGKRRKAALIAKAKKRIESFVEHTHVDPNDGLSYRRTQALAVIYAALRFAVDWGVLPLRNVGRIMLACHARIAAFQGIEADEPAALDRVRAYVKTHRKALKGHKKAKGRKMTDEVLAALPGLTARRKGRNVLLISPERWNAEFENHAGHMLDELHRQSRLQITGVKGRQLQIKVRANSDKDRMYAIVMK